MYIFASFFRRENSAIILQMDNFAEACECFRGGGKPVVKKRTLTAILAVLLCLTLLTGCGGASQAARTTETPHLTQAAQSKEDQPAQTPAAQGTALSGQMGYQTRYLEIADDGITAALSNGTDAGNAI